MIRAGTGIALLIVGAILAFGINQVQIAGFNISIIGYIFLAAGALALVLALVGRSATRRESVSDSRGNRSERVVRSDQGDPTI